LAAAQGHDKAAGEAAELRANGVTPKAVAPAPAASEPAPADEMAAPAPEMAATPDARPSDAETAADSMATGDHRIWLRSERDAAAAAAALAEARARHPEIFAAARGAVVAVDLGEGGTFHRVVAKGLANDAATALCRRLRAADPEAFCKVQASN
jgi:hypothetical protein